MAQLPNMSRLRLQPCAVATGAKKRKALTPPAKPPGQPAKKPKDAEHYREEVNIFFKEHRLNDAQRRELLAIIAEYFPQHAFPEGDWIESALPQSLLATIPDGDTQAGQWRWKVEQLRLAVVELHKRETARKKTKGAPGSSKQQSAKKMKSDQQAAEDAANAKKPQAVMGREDLSDKQKRELSNKFPSRYDLAAPKVLGAKKAPGCCMQRR